MSNAVSAFLLEHNTKQSELFTSPDHVAARTMYKINHPTEIGAIKCMDGRVHLAVTTQTEPGIIQPFRNIGGKFDLGWPHFGQVFQKWVEYGTRASGLPVVSLNTYHFSKGDHHRGCAGHAYDTDAALRGAMRLKEQTERVFGKSHAMVYPIVAGVETDEDALVLHGAADGQVLRLADLHPSISATELESKVAALFPGMRAETLRDIMPLVTGNIAHIAEMRALNRPVVDIEHRENVIAIGRGFDWLHLINKALIVGPYSPDLASPIGVAGKVVLGNLKAGRIDPAEGIVLISSAIHREEGYEKTRAAEKARTMAQIGYDALEAAVPELMQHVHVMAGTLDEDTRLFSPVPFEPAKVAPVRIVAAAH